MTTQDVRLSVGLVTRNRPESLERTLASLRAQNVQPFEVIVSDDSDEPHAAEVRRIAEKFGCSYVQGPRRGLYANRNAILDAASGTHIRTMDDDHEFPEGHVAACTEAISTDADSVWIIGEFTPAEIRDPPPECPPQLHPRGFSVTPPDPDDCWGIADGASIYPRRIFDAGNRFADFVQFGALYLEFGSRLHWLGYRIRFLPTTYVVHHYDPSTRSFDDRRIDLAARFFAMLCHAAVYQPSLRNRLLAFGEIVRQLFRSPMTAAAALADAWPAFRARRATAPRSHARPIV